MPAAALRRFFGIDPVPATLTHAYAQLRVMCLRDHPAAEHCLLTQDGLHAYFIAAGLEASVVVFIEKWSSKPPNTRKTEVTINITGTARLELERAAEMVNDAFHFADCCKRQLKRWGMM